MKTILKLRNRNHPATELKVEGPCIELRDKKFTFDRIYDSEDDAGVLFDTEILPVLDKCLTIRHSYEAIVAYGCTSSGKTHTMQNDQDGILITSIKHLLDHLPEGMRLRVGCLEVWRKNACKDLLADPESADATSNSKQPAFAFTPNILQDNSHVKVSIKNLEHCRELLAQIFEQRKVSATNANEVSSRSHLLMFFDIYSEDNSTFSTLIFGDLAGSERFKNTLKSDARHVQEAGFINESLQAFHKVILAIREKRSHIPVRDSKLTHLLSRALIGSGELSLLILVNADPAFTSENVHVLEFGTVLRQVTNMRARVDTRTPASFSAKRHLDFASLVREIVDSPVKNSGSSSSGVDSQESWEAAVESMIRDRESAIRQELAAEHALNSDRLRDLYENIMNESLAETEVMFNRKMDVLAKSYEDEIAQMKRAINLLERKPLDISSSTSGSTEQLESLKMELSACKEAQLRETTGLKQQIVEGEDRYRSLLMEYESLEDALSTRDEEIKTLAEKLQVLTSQATRDSTHGNQRLSDILNLSPIRESLNQIEDELGNEDSESDYIDDGDEEMDNYKTPQSKRSVSEIPAVNATPEVEDHQQSIFSNTGLRSAFKLQVPRQVQKLSGKRMKEAAHEDQENLPNNQDQQQKRKIKLRQKRAVIPDEIE